MNQATTRARRLVCNTRSPPTHVRGYTAFAIHVQTTNTNSCTQASRLQDIKQINSGKAHRTFARHESQANSCKGIAHAIREAGQRVQKGIALAIHEAGQSVQRHRSCNTRSRSTHEAGQLVQRHRARKTRSRPTRARRRACNTGSRPTHARVHCVCHTCGDNKHQLMHTGIALARHKADQLW